MEKNDFILKFTQLASDDLEQIYGYIANKLYAQYAADNLREN